MNRTQMGLAAFLGLQLVVIIFMYAPLSGAAAGAEARPFVPMLESMTPAKVSIEDNEGRSLTMTRQESHWSLPDSGGYPVESSRVEELLENFRHAEVRRPVVSSSRYHDALKVGDSEHERRVRIWDISGDDPKVEILTGTSPNYRITHARTGDDDRVYEVSGLNAWAMRAEAGAWVEKKFVDMPFDQVTGMRLENPEGIIEVEKQQGQWVLRQPAAKDRELDSAKIDGLVRSFAALFLQDPVGKMDAAAQGLENPAATLTLTRIKTAPVESVPPLSPLAALTADADGAAANAAAADTADKVADAGALADATDADLAAAAPASAPETETVTVRVGAVRDESSGQRYAVRSGFEYTVTLSKADSDKALNQKLVDLLKE